MVGCSAELGGFAGLFDLKAAGFGTDGVGTKLKIAQACRQLDGLGQDLVAMCVNDVLAQAVEPLFFLLDFTCDRLDIDVAASVVSGIAKACEKAGCALLGEVFLTPTKINSRLLLLRILRSCQSLRSHHWWGASGEHPLGDAPGTAGGFRRRSLSLGSSSDHQVAPPALD
ncbi:trifunctional purine biosynthetic protein adenosine-3-like [Amphiprion ocellaris]|uniref:trifunctional purine biosynthetic protein adenosine-3-like n=1 Tax=Amphiprion ocellaris TaxID=80972 RepID=UPI0024113A21|nr:trifunctional purine biosynthetic protein adenosine-3-like [Amphiprion ocellaris]